MKRAFQAFAVFLAVACGTPGGEECPDIVYCRNAVTNEQVLRCGPCDQPEVTPPSNNVIDNGDFTGLGEYGVSGWSIINATRYTEGTFSGNPSQWDCQPATSTSAAKGCCWHHSVSWWEVQNLPNPYAKFHEYSSGCALASTQKDVYPNYRVRFTFNYSVNNSIESGPVEGDELGARVRWYDSTGTFMGSNSVSKFFWTTDGATVNVDRTVTPPSGASKFDIIIGKLTPENLADVRFDNVKAYYVP